MPEPTYDVYRPTSHPVPEPPLERSGPPAYDERERRVPSGGGAPWLAGAFTPVILCVVVWAMSGGGYFWPMWVFFAFMVMGGRGCVGGRGRRRHW